MFDRNIFGTRIKELRMKRGLKQDEFGKVFGLSKQTVSGIETGYRTTTIEMLVAFADFFNVSIDWLVGRIDEPTIPQKNELS